MFLIIAIFTTLVSLLLVVGLTVRHRQSKRELHVLQGKLNDLAAEYYKYEVSVDEQLNEKNAQLDWMHNLLDEKDEHLEKKNARLGRMCNRIDRQSDQLDALEEENHILKVELEVISHDRSLLKKELDVLRTEHDLTSA